MGKNEKKYEETVKKLEKLGFVQDKEIKYIYWLNGHCAMVKQNGEVEEL